MNKIKKGLLGLMAFSIGYASWSYLEARQKFSDCEGTIALVWQLPPNEAGIVTLLGFDPIDFYSRPLEEERRIDPTIDAYFGIDGWQCWPIKMENDPNNPQN